MKFTASVESFKEAMHKAIISAAKKDPRPILACAKVTANDFVTIETTDLASRIWSKVLTATVESPGHICVSAKLLHGYISALEGEYFTFELLTEKNVVRVGDENSRFHMNIVRAEDFPIETSDVHCDPFDISIARVIETVSKMWPFASSDETRRNLRGMCISPGGEVATTDGHRQIGRAHV